jgi:uncharacterized protein YebE (UPF0316 family)
MDYELLVVFIVLNIVNVIIQTVKSIATIRCGKGMASVVNAIAYGLYTVVVVYTVCDLPLWLKVVVVGLCNLVGVFCVKWGEEKARKDKLWKVEATINEPYKESLIDALKKANLPFNYIEGVGKYVLFNIYCPTQEESKAVKGLLDFHKAKYFVTESKTL